MHDVHVFQLSFTLFYNFLLSTETLVFYGNCDFRNTLKVTIHIVLFVLLLLYIPGQQLWSWRDG